MIESEGAGGGIVDKICRRKNVSGLSLVEVTIAMGIMAIGIVGLMSYMSLGTKQEKSVHDTFELNSIVSEIGQTLSNPAACSNGLSGQDFDPSPGTASDLKIGNYQKGVTVGGWTIKSLTASVKNSGGTPFSVLNGGQPYSGYFVAISLEVESRNPQNLGGRGRTRTIPATFVVGPGTTKKIANCYGDQVSAMAQSCEALGGQLYYPDCKFGPSHDMTLAEYIKDLTKPTPSPTPSAVAVVAPPTDSPVASDSKTCSNPRMHYAKCDGGWYCSGDKYAYVGPTEGCVYNCPAKRRGDIGCGKFEAL